MQYKWKILKVRGGEPENIGDLEMPKVLSDGEDDNEKKVVIFLYGLNLANGTDKTIKTARRYASKNALETI
jgi:hypothetical protein